MEQTLDDIESLSVCYEMCAAGKRWMKKQPNVCFFPAFFYVERYHKEMIVLNPNSIWASNMSSHFNYLFSYNLIHCEVFFPVQYLILTYVFDIFKVVK